jgi:hypothetical protein
MRGLKKTSKLAICFCLIAVSLTIVPQAVQAGSKFLSPGKFKPWYTQATFNQTAEIIRGDFQTKIWVSFGLPAGATITKLTYWHQSDPLETTTTSATLYRLRRGRKALKLAELPSASDVGDTIVRRSTSSISNPVVPVGAKFMIEATVDSYHSIFRGAKVEYN